MECRCYSLVMMETINTPETERSTKKVVLIVDDDLVLGKFYQYALEDDFDVIVVSSGEEAISTLKNQGKVDLMVLDILLPGMSGMEVLKEMKTAIPSRPPVMVVTAHGDEGIAAQTSLLGAIDYVEKPFDAGKLLNKIRGHFEKIDL
jgi:two-component system nitrogen regulation response regulator NtrX